jgi:uncharacterized membrane protein
MASFPDAATTGSAPTKVRRWFPFIVLLFAAVVLLEKWPDLPERWVIHWGPDGEPDGWATRTPLLVFFPLLAGGFVCGFLEMLATLVIRRPRVRSGITASPEGAAKIAAVTGEIVRMISLFVAALFATIAVALPLFRPQTPLLVIGAALVIAIVPTTIGLVRLRRTARRLKAAGEIDGRDGWSGISYRDRADRRFIVPKAFVPGFKLNFGNRLAWPITILSILIPVLIVLLLARVI